jgi:hypothetical protein
MVSGYIRQHLRVERFVDLRPYKRPNRAMGSKDLGRETEQHAEQLERDLAVAWASTDGLIAERDPVFIGEAGRYVDFDTLPDQPLPDLAWASKGIRLASASRADDGVAKGTLFVPDDAQSFLDSKLDEYRSNRGEKGRPSHEARFVAIEHFRAARLESLWVDSRPIPNAGVPTWWECWCWPDRVQNLDAKAVAAAVLVGEGRLRFAERVVIFLYTDRTMLGRIVASCDAVAELRLGRDDAAFFSSGEGRDDAEDWVANATARIESGPNRDAVAVCLLDTGINSAHPLLAHAFAADDLHSVNPAWGVDDHHGHGSEMSGLAVYGDLTTTLPSADPITLNYAGEGVKLLPPAGFPLTEPQSYGLVTQQAILRPEIARPDRERVYCMAVTQPEGDQLERNA